MVKILVVDDDKRINELIKEIFEMEGFEVYSAFDGSEAIEILDKIPGIQLALLDVMMPNIDGWGTLAYIKSRFDTKVIMLTALGDEESEVRGIRSGADDYITKPFKRAVLLERARRMVGCTKDGNDVRYISGDLFVSQAECRAYVKGQPIKTTTKELQLLILLMKNAPNALDRETILYKVWGYEYDGNDRTIDTHIKMLRQALGECGNKIRTIRGMGYSFDAEVIVK